MRYECVLESFVLCVLCVLWMLWYASTLSVALRLSFGGNAVTHMQAVYDGCLSDSRKQMRLNSMLDAADTKASRSTLRTPPPPPADPAPVSDTPPLATTTTTEAAATEASDAPAAAAAEETPAA